MKGLFIKDLKLMKMQVRFFAAVIVLAVFLSWNMEGSEFMFGYLCFVLPLFTLSTLSYDEFDNGYAFLFSLPITRVGYVVEKYILGSFLGLIGYGIALVVSVAMGSIRSLTEFLDTLLTAPGILSITLIFLSVTLPVQLKFGSEKGRIAMILIAGIPAAAIMGLGNLLNQSDIKILHVLLDFITDQPGIAAAIATVLVLLILGSSMKISISIMKKKEF